MCRSEPETKCRSEGSKGVRERPARPFHPARRPKECTPGHIDMFGAAFLGTFSQLVVLFFLRLAMCVHPDSKLRVSGCGALHTWQLVQFMINLLTAGGMNLGESHASEDALSAQCYEEGRLSSRNRKHRATVFSEMCATNFRRTRELILQSAG